MIAAFVATCAVLGFLANIAQLGVFPTRVARAMLWAVGLTFLLYLVIQIWQLYFMERIRELEAKLATESTNLSDLRSAVERINDRDKLSSSETLDLTVCIGVDDHADRIIEKRVTFPRPRVTSRTMRPIVPDHHHRPARLADIGLTAELEDGQIAQLALNEQIGKLNVLLVFEPAITKVTEWRVEYRPAGLWRPLRSHGFDALRWNDRLHHTDGTPSAFTSFTARFLFPPGNRPNVLERHDYGKLIKHEQTSDGTWEVVWRDDKPAGRRYEWDLTQPVRSGPAP